MARKPKPEEPDKFNTPKPHDMPEDATTDPADTSGPHGPGSELPFRRTRRNPDPPGNQKVIAVPRSISQEWTLLALTPGLLAPTEGTGTVRPKPDRLP